MALRRAHVYRIFQTDDQDNVIDPDTWVDVLRLDRFTVSEPRGAPSSEDHLMRDYVFVWGDDTVRSMLTAHRKLHKYRISQPPPEGSTTPDPNAPYIDIPLLEQTTVSFRGPQAEGLAAETHDENFWCFRNDGLFPRREKAIRVYNDDLNSNACNMPVAKAGEPQPPTLHKVQWPDYVRALQAGTVDRSQFVDVYVTREWRARVPPPSFKGQMVIYALVQTQQTSATPGPLDLYEAAPVSGAGTIYRLDPLQTIVNISWGGLAVEFGDQDQDSPAFVG